ncbi:hypothetical protein E4T56_gene18875 [Termitomyces sp. T112]|nr:hypothetical protein E4T56_gene18875 [Termitomyces sp. T112]
MSKVLKHVEPIALCIAKSTDFIFANSTSQAKTMLALKSTASQLESVSSFLSKIITKLDTLLPAQAPQPAINCPTWADIASTKPTANIPTKYSPYTSPQHTCFQQRLIHNAKTILVTINTTCAQAPTKHTPAVNAELHDCTNKLLEEVANLGQTWQPLTESLPLLQRLTSVESPGYNVELTSSSLTHQTKTCLGPSVQVIDKAHALIVCFAPCGGVFDPSSAANIATFKVENSLEPDCIISAVWLKKEDCCHAKQTVASLKVLCNSAQAANHLLHEWVFVAGHWVVVCKDLKELLQCNKCHNLDHTFDTCSSETPPSYVSCKPDSTHTSSSHTCPVFRKHCDDLDTPYPENSMLYFPTGDPSTWATNPKKLSRFAPIPTPWVDHSANPEPLGLRQYQLLWKPSHKAPSPSQASSLPSSSQ